MMGTDTAVKRKVHLKVLLLNCNVMFFSPKHGISLPAGRTEWALLVKRVKSEEKWKKLAPVSTK
jgi:hypothetical protein